jgi:hypothetical protein
MVIIFSYIKSVQSFKGLCGLTKATSLSIAVIGLLFVGRVWATPDISAEYSDCVLEKMQGQDASVLPFAHRVCESSFPYRKTLYKRNDYVRYKFFDEWSWLNNGRIVSDDSAMIGMAFAPNSSKNKLVQIKVGFGEKKDNDGKCLPSKFITFDVFVTKDGESVAGDLNLAKENFVCVDLYQVWGMRKLGE